MGVYGKFEGLAGKEQATNDLLSLGIKGRTNPEKAWMLLYTIAQGACATRIISTDYCCEHHTIFNAFLEYERFKKYVTTQAAQDGVDDVQYGCVVVQGTRVLFARGFDNDVMPQVDEAMIRQWAAEDGVDISEELPEVNRVLH
jgi:hypothetical protein